MRNKDKHKGIMKLVYKVIYSLQGLTYYYKNEKFIKVMPFGADVEAGGEIFSDAAAGWDGYEIFVTGNDERVVVASRFDNLGKGASGAAIQCMNIVMGCDEAKGLSL